MNNFLTKEIELNGDDMSSKESDNIDCIIYDALFEKGILCVSLSWSINVEYVPRSNDDE